MAYSHLDKPDNPALRIVVLLESVGLYYSKDDGLDGNAELIIGWSVNHHYHDNAGGIITIDDFNWDYESTSMEGGKMGKERFIGKIVYSHVECSPMNSITLSVTIKEDDSDVITSITAGVIAAITGITATALSTGTAIIVATGAAISAVTSLISGLGSAEDLGSSSFTVSSPGVHVVKTKYGFVKFRVNTVELSSSVYDCGIYKKRETTKAETPTTTTTTSIVTEEKHIPTGDESGRLTEEMLEDIRRGLDDRLDEGKNAFNTLRGALRDALNMNAEPGVAGISDKDIMDDREKLASTTLKLIDPWVYLIVKMCLDTSNASATAIEALNSFYDARDMASRKMYMESLNSYEDAWRLSIETLFKRHLMSPNSSLSIRVVDENMNAVESVTLEFYRGGEQILLVAPTSGVVGGIPLEPGLYNIKV